MPMRARDARCENLKGVEPEMETKLRQAAQAFIDAPKQLQAAIIEAAAADVDAVQIAQAVSGAYGVDYVRKLIRDARRDGKLKPRAES